MTDAILAKRQEYQRLNNIREHYLMLANNYLRLKEGYKEKTSSEKPVLISIRNFDFFFKINATKLSTSFIKKKILSIHL